jgi:thiol-disulfide isomerase/thioredoxin
VSNRPSRSPSASARVRQASKAGGGGNTTWLWVGLVVLVVVVGLVAVMVSRSSDSSNAAKGGSASPSGGTVVPNGDLDYGSVDVQGTALPTDSQSTTIANDPAAGQPIPTITGQTFDGSPITVAPDGQPQVVMVVAHWCPHCQAEVPRIQQWLDDNGMPPDVQLTTIATANDPSRGNFPAGDWLRGQGWSVPTMIDDKNSDAGAAMGVGGFPYFVVVGADGNVVMRASGEITMDQWQQILDAARTGQAPTA